MNDWDKLMEPAREALEALIAEGDAMADRIEALTEQLAAARRDAEEAEAYARELEQQLGKAVDALRAFNSFDDLPTEVKRPDIFEINVRLPILRALAELTGGKDE